ncbi:hypothetical protein M6B38_290575 [Iris pallida]|uniref:Uncharacterized protein n=1 Tax=Iris pallida TaxID=29817 RepID=A0AAX6HVY5_IRIPA|nr:hypothetical protein M6B38_290575 [Iris pallida]
MTPPLQSPESRPSAARPRRHQRTEPVLDSSPQIPLLGAREPPAGDAFLPGPVVGLAATLYARH